MVCGAMVGLTSILDRGQFVLYCLCDVFSVCDDCRQHNNEIELLFHMLRCFTARYIPQFQFFKEFLDETVSQVRNFRKQVYKQVSK